MHTSQLAAAKQQLQQQLTDLLDQQEKLCQHKLQLQEQVEQLQQQQQQHLGDNLQLQQRIQQLQASQQQLQETSALLSTEVVAARDHLSHSAEQAAAPPGGAPSGATSTKRQEADQRQQEQQQVLDSVAAAGAGDLQLQISVPGFTDALVTRIGEAELVPQFAAALVNQVNSAMCHTSLPHATAALLL